MIFMITLMSGTLISISSGSWLGAWMGLEINLISFIPIISNKNNILSTESSMKYFLVQALASSSFLISIIILMKINKINEFEILNWSAIFMLNSSLLMKMGAAPLHFWFPEIMSKLNWMQAAILATWQKMAPIMLVSYSLTKSNSSIIFIVSSVIIGSIIGLNQTSMMKIMAYSSINHIGWMLASMMFMENVWMIYFLTYSILTLGLMLTLKTFNIFNIKQLFLNMNNKMMLKFSFIINFLSLGGLPPFLGFFPKWIVIQNMINEKLMVINFFMIMMTMITLFFYLRVSFSVLMMSYNEMNWKIILNFNSIKNHIFLLNSLSMFGLIISTLLMNMT